MQSKTWKVGDLSKLTGLTIRTLHHYDEIGLLHPTFHTEAGHRLYSEEDIIKLQQIMSLKQLDFSLDEIKEFFGNPKYNPKEVIEMQLKRLDEEIKLKNELKGELKELLDVFNSWNKPSFEQLIHSIQLIRNQKKYFTREQRMKLKKQYHKLDDSEMNVQAVKWTKLITSFQDELDKGTPVDDPKVIELAKAWQEGMNFFTGGDKGIIHSAERYYIENPSAAKGSGMSGELYKYIQEILLNIK
ncbi:MerR family transcriptional regulator [Clostridium sp. 'White wine YQ']|uniref:MerR family transcriptional regulator n=1 Tax=Clostridium sp. 'White wine YQ' TaxID=3027474 RepID=UPI002365D605|nr:MerR family transcriptional regulator [Clostridium sp. 'White wine YQ']MDD7795508.1 MerR family transcriptional regulator [Clostridium sp. 'White wine YQ']